MLTLFRLALLSIVRQPVALAAFLVVPALLVFVSADALGRFGEVLGVGEGHHHPSHIGILSGMWAAGITAALISALTVAEADRADTVLAVRYPMARWITARGAALVVVSGLAVLVSIGFTAIRYDGVGAGVWLGAAYNALLYVMIGQLVAYFTRDAVFSVGSVSGLWILDALTAPSMTSGTWWQPVVSPFYSAEHAAMGNDVGAGEITALVVWPVLVGAASLAVLVVRPRRRAPAAAAAPPPAAVPGGGGVTRGGVALLLTDLLRHRGLLGFVVAGPLGLMLSSLWLFGGIEVAVPAVEDGRRTLITTTMPQLHAAYMGMIAVVGFSGTVGFLIATDLHAPDGRLGHRFRRTGRITAFRVGTLLGAATAVTVSALVLVPIVRTPENWTWFITAHLLAAWTFALFGYCVGLALDRVSGILVTMFFPFIDVGIAQDYMLGPVLPDWAVFLPSHPFAQLSISSAFGESVFDPAYLAWSAALLALALLAVLTVTARRTSLRL
ncbi:hypothetical protein [Actinocorallia populi]|uniref:hypothetical protein n=1 Tax=Actinocorallia populi TaxID=2079200 RepID=UPI000D0869EB|nr:hypothetical protein [Actinocorallia populi]